jgi:hypothetical protein
VSFAEHVSDLHGDSGLTLRDWEFVVALDQLGFALRYVGKKYVEHLAVPGLQTVAMGWWG